MKNEKGEEITQKKCRGKHVDDECKIRHCKKAQYGCIISDLKKKGE